MKQLRILNTREIKHIGRLLEQQHGCALPEGSALLQDTKNRLFLASRGISAIEFEKLRLTSIGLYAGELNKFGELRLSMEASQLLGPKATRNILELDAAQLRTYFQGQEIALTADIKGQPFLLLKHRNDFFGSAKYKDGKLLNYLPKVHRAADLIV